MWSFRSMFGFCVSGIVVNTDNYEQQVQFLSCRRERGRQKPGIRQKMLNDDAELYDDVFDVRRRRRAVCRRSATSKADWDVEGSLEEEEEEARGREGIWQEEGIWQADFWSRRKFFGVWSFLEDVEGSRREFFGI